ncbi:MAG TPA: hypothetical protein VG276_11120 [Actinomycetes bacterium]|jgi:hypothetical protein|nr:hypothetical protein [Actinomycetes bacterium]
MLGATQQVEAELGNGIPAGTTHVAFATVPRPGKTNNEDLVAAVGSAAWVLDGSSVPPGLPSCCDRDAGWYVGRLSAGIAAALADQAIDLPPAVAAAISSVTAEHEAACPAGKARSVLGPSATVALVRRRGNALDYLLLGDTALLLETDQGVTHQSDRRLAQIAPDLRERLRVHLRNGGGYHSPRYREMLASLVETERALRNAEDGYWIASNDPTAAYHSVTGSRSIGTGPGEVRRFALLSDGFERTVAVFGLYASWADLMAALVRDGPAKCLAALRAAETADPHGRRFPRTAASDDASALVSQAGPLL